MRLPNLRPNSRRFRLYRPPLNRYTIIAASVIGVALLIAAFNYWYPSDESLFPVESDESTPTTLAEYRARLAAAEDSLAEVNVASEPDVAPKGQTDGATGNDEDPENVNPDSPAAQARLAEIRADLVAIRRVALPGGDTVVVMPILGEVPDPAAEAPGDAPLTVAAAIARLHVAIAQIDAAPTDNTEARLAALKSVLARGEFLQPFNLWQRIQRWLRDLLRRFFSGEERDSQANPGVIALAEGIAWALVVAGAILILFFLTFWLQRILSHFVTDAETRRAALDDEDFPQTSQEARRQARTAADAGDYRSAVRRLYLSALLLLDERRIIRYDRWLTNREVLAQMSQDNPARAHMEPVVDTFDTVWYGVREPDAAAFAAYEQEIDRLSEIAKHAAEDAPEASTTKAVTQDEKDGPEKEVVA